MANWWIFLTRKYLYNKFVIQFYSSFNFLYIIYKYRDFGFDPLGFGEVPENLERYKESELIHCRWAMLAVVSFFFSNTPI